MENDTFIVARDGDLLRINDYAIDMSMLNNVDESEREGLLNLAVGAVLFGGLR